MAEGIRMQFNYPFASPHQPMDYSGLEWPLLWRKWWYFRKNLPHWDIDACKNWWETFRIWRLWLKLCLSLTLGNAVELKFTLSYLNTLQIPISWQADTYYPMKHNTKEGKITFFSPVNDLKCPSNCKNSASKIFFKKVQPDMGSKGRILTKAEVKWGIGKKPI